MPLELVVVGEALDVDVEEGLEVVVMVVVVLVEEGVDGVVTEVLDPSQVKTEGPILECRISTTMSR